MLKKIIFVLLIFNFLHGCGFTPMYSSNNQKEVTIEKINFSGDEELNNFIEKSLKKYEKDEGQRKFSLSISTKYSKVTITKDSAGNTTNFQIISKSNISVISKNINKNFTIVENFIMENYSDELEEKRFETSIKNNLSNLIVDRMITQLSLIK